jgi:Ca2+-binding EF-hand superfamily protein
MRTYLIVAGAAGLGLLAAAGSAMAQQGQAQPMPRMFMQADQNGDGVVDKNEYMHLREQIFSRLDKNGDGQVTQEELMEARSARAGTMSGAPGMRQGRAGTGMQRADKNGDGVISRAEWDARTEELFALRDRNKDGRIEPDETGRLPRAAQP